MGTKDWGNNAQERILTTQHSSLNYFKLFCTIVLSIITASIILTLLGWMFFFSLASAFISVSKPTHSPPAQIIQTQPQRVPIQRTQIQPQIAPRLTPKQEAEIRENVQLCKYWTEQYQQDKNDRFRRLRDSYCSKFGK